MKEVLRAVMKTSSPYLSIPFQVSFQIDLQGRSRMYQSSKIHVILEHCEKSVQIQSFSGPYLAAF